jgi:hypothetical protein
MFLALSLLLASQNEVVTHHFEAEVVLFESREFSPHFHCIGCLIHLDRRPGGERPARLARLFHLLGSRLFAARQPTGERVLYILS